MPSDHYKGPRQALVAELRSTGRFSDAVLDAIGQVPRHAFVPPGLRGHAYENVPLSIGHGQTISQPAIVAEMTDLLDLEAPGEVLDVGGGSGYQAAVLAQLGHRITSVEILPELAAAARATLAELGYSGIWVHCADGWQGWPKGAPFDGILMAATAPTAPMHLVSQLREGRRIVVPVLEQGFEAERLWTLQRSGDRAIVQKHGWVRFVPMTGLAQG
jgi:protein-L-isoaspartate(D-aspartate) O-methyltransferase